MGRKLTYWNSVDELSTTAPLLGAK